MDNLKANFMKTSDDQTMNSKWLLTIFSGIYPNNSRNVYLYIYSVFAYMG